MYLPWPRSASKLARAFSSTPAPAGVPFGQPFVGQVTVGLVVALRPRATRTTAGNRARKPTATIPRAISLLIFSPHQPHSSDTLGGLIDEASHGDTLLQTSLLVIERETSNMFTHCVGEHPPNVAMNLSSRVTGYSSLIGLGKSCRRFAQKAFAVHFCHRSQGERRSAIWSRL